MRFTPEPALADRVLGERVGQDLRRDLAAKLETPSRILARVGLPGLGAKLGQRRGDAGCPARAHIEIGLSPAERWALQARAVQYAPPYADVVCAEMIVLAAEGWSNSAIAERLDTRREVKSQWRKRFFHARLAGLEDHPRSGRPRALFP